MTIDAATVRENLERVRQRIAGAGADPDAVRVIAVTKGFGPDAAVAALAAGLADLGENYAQELLDKAAAVASDTVEWHFIGRLQSNKVRLVADVVSCWQSVDRPSLIDEIASRAPGSSILVQVNATGETGKGGCDPGSTPDLVGRARSAGLAVSGLMAVGHTTDERSTAAAFEQVSGIADTLGLVERSMGMTADLEAAVRAGSTMVRVGTALFGPRPERRDAAR